MRRNTECILCVWKHLAQAMIIHEEEVPNGYPNHIRRVIGHLAEASREALPAFTNLATCLRQHRIRVMETPSYMPPYDELLGYSEAVLALLDQDPKATVPCVPDDLWPANTQLQPPS